MSAYIIGSGAYLPEREVSNEELAEPLGREAERIFKSSGIRSRRWADSEATTSGLAARALRRALDDAQVTTAEIDYLMLGTTTPDRFIPGSAPAVQKTLELNEIPCLDLRAACCNALYAFQIAKALVTSGAARNVAICLAELQSQFLDLTRDAGTLAMLFGDGAAALIVSADARPGALEIVDVYLATDGGYADDLGVRCPGTEFGTTKTHPIEQFATDYAPRMNGQSVILQASRRMVAASRTILERNRLAVKDVRWLVPHQANANLLAQVSRGLELSDTPCEVISVLAKTGNTSSASMGIALDTLRGSKKVCADDYLLLPAFGAGFTWGAGLCRAV